MRAPHFAHAAATQQLDQPVATKRSALHQSRPSRPRSAPSTEHAPSSAPS
jgi:hypothetical protein